MRLFVYGTLMRGEANGHLLSRARLVCETRTVAGFRLLDLGDYPGMVAGGSGCVAGELYELDRDLIPALDRFEGHPDLFERSRIGLQGGAIAESYWLRRASIWKSKEISSGDWRRR